MDILIGADPEIFVKDQNGNIVSAFGMIPGTKNEPHKVNFGAVQVDGMALEFNIDPVQGSQAFHSNIIAVMDQLQAMLPEGHTFAIQPTAEFGKEYIDAQPKQASDLGCDPDYDAYTGQPNPKPNVEAPFRTASGHIHIGWTKDMDPFDPGHFEACQMLTKQLDILLGVPSLMWDPDTKRRELYGKPGAFRPKPYGCEYRVLSNAWLTSPHLISFVYHNTIHAVDKMLQGQRYWDTDYGYSPFKYFVEKPNWYSIWDMYTGFVSPNVRWETKNFLEEQWSKRYNESLLVKPKKSLGLKQGAIDIVAAGNAPQPAVFGWQVDHVIVDDVLPEAEDLEEFLFNGAVEV